MSVTTTTEDVTNICPQCGTSFRCGMEGGDKECWCARLPPVWPVPPASDSSLEAATCLCPNCLTARLESLGR